MAIIADILAQPLNFVLHILHKIQTISPLVNDGLTGRRPFEVALAGRLAGWVLLAVIVAWIVFLVLRFVLEDATTGSVTTRLIVILIAYVILAVLLYAFSGLSNLLLSEPRYKRLR